MPESVAARMLIWSAALLAATVALCDDVARAKRAGATADDAFSGESAGQVRDDNSLRMKLVWCPRGFVTMEFIEGAVTFPKVVHVEVVDEAEGQVIVRQTIEETTTGEKRAARAFVTQGYWLGRYEVTQAEWRAVMGTEPWTVQPSPIDAPDVAAIYITWNNAREFCRRLTETERRAGRLPRNWEYTLPTEAQWERACRARTETDYSFGDDPARLAEFAWYRLNAVDAGEHYPHRVGQKKPNPWGLYDMHGNVREWCLDVYVEKLPGGRDPLVSDGGQNRVCRGGNYWLPANSCRSSARDSSPPEGSISFRVALCQMRKQPAVSHVTKTPPQPAGASDPADLPEE